MAAPDDYSTDEFAENVVSGLEQALVLEEGEAAEPHPDDEVIEITDESEVFFAGWGGPEEEQPAESEPRAIRPPGREPAKSAQPVRVGLCHLVSLCRLLRGLGRRRYQQARRIGRRRAIGTLSVYGEGPAPHQLRTIFQSFGSSAEPAPSGMGWNAGLTTGFAQPAGDGLSPQEVILNYFDYTPASQNGNGSAAGDFGTSPDYGMEPPIAFRPRPDTDGQPQNARGPQEQPVRRPEWQAASAQSGQYNGPPSFPVPAEVSAASKPSGPAGHESSRLLGAAAIGLMGGIAIAASLAAFLIYGPHPATLEIPGIGNLRLDKDEQGYGRAALEEGPRESLKSPAVKAPNEFSSEILAADAVAVPGQPSPLTISVKSPQPFEKTLVNITGIPEGGRLSAGVDTGGGNWLLPPRRLKGLTINLPAGLSDPVSIEAQLLDSNARTPLSPKNKFVIHVQPAAAPAFAADTLAAGTPAIAAKQAQQPASVGSFNTQTVAQPALADTRFKTETIIASPTAASGGSSKASLVPGTSPSGQEAAKRKANARPEVEDLIREGNKRMREGDILEARLYYEKAVALGDPEAALAMGRSYDPIYFARIDKKNAEPDPAKAFEWYRRAMDAGAAQTALVRIENLKHFLNM